MITRLVLVAAIAAAGITAVAAQSDPLTQRKAIMKGVGEQSRVARDMLDGKTPFNADAAKKVFSTFEEAAGKMPGLFPDNSKSGDTAALPAIWENKSDFTAKFAKFGADAKAAAAQVKDLDSFKAAMGDVG